MTQEQAQSLKKFKATHKPIRTLIHHKDEILDLKNNGYTSNQVVEYLKIIYDISRTTQTIDKFIAQYKNENTSTTSNITDVQQDFFNLQN